jgi:hypothetical protein
VFELGEGGGGGGEGEQGKNKYVSILSNDTDVMAVNKY